MIVVGLIFISLQIRESNYKAFERLHTVTWIYFVYEFSDNAPKYTHTLVDIVYDRTVYYSTI